MKKINLLLLSVAVISMVFTSCKKDNDDNACPSPCDTTGTDTTTHYSNYSRLKVGNYWIYQQFTLYPDGTEAATNIFDSSWVEKDTVINGHTYYKFFNPNFLYPDGFGWLRDSLHYVVSSSGNAVFSSSDFNTLWEDVYVFSSQTDTLYHRTAKMDNQNISYTTPAGTFLTTDYLTRFDYYNGFGSGTPRFMHRRYAENMGIVSETLPFFASSPNYTEKKLIRYHFN